jgi:hypothetical protein
MRMTVLMEHRTCPNFQLGRILEEIADYKKSFWQCGKEARPANAGRFLRIRAGMSMRVVVYW